MRMRLLALALVAVAVLGQGLEAVESAGEANGVAVEGLKEEGRDELRTSTALSMLRGLNWARAGELQRRKGGGGAKGGSFSGGSKSSGSSFSGGSKSSGSSLGKSTYSNPAPVSSSVKTGTYRTSTSTGARLGLLQGPCPPIPNALKSTCSSRNQPSAPSPHPHKKPLWAPHHRQV